VADEPQVTVGRAHEGDDQARALFERRHDPARVLALSDGVFAIIITLLVLDVRVPEPTQGLAWAAALGRSGPRLPRL
jgi:hypothetical protein